MGFITYIIYVIIGAITAVFGVFIWFISTTSKTIKEVKEINDNVKSFRFYRKNKKQAKEKEELKTLANKLGEYCPNMDKFDAVLTAMYELQVKLEGIEINLNNHIKKDVVRFADRIFFLSEQYQRRGFLSMKEKKILAAQAYEYFKDGGNSDAGESFKIAMTLPYIKGEEKVEFSFNKFMESGGKIWVE